MATQNLALVGADSTLAPVIVNYTLRSQSGNKWEYVGVNSDDSLAAPRLITNSFDIKAPGVVGNDRVHSNIRRVVLDSENLPHTGSTSTQISIPRTPAWTVADTVSLLKQQAHYLAGVAAAIEGATDTAGFPELWAAMIAP